MLHTRMTQLGYCRSRVSALAQRLHITCSAGRGTGSPENDAGIRTLHEGMVVADVGLGQRDHVLQVQLSHMILPENNECGIAL